jgi:hypothetical protein
VLPQRPDHVDQDGVARRGVQGRQEVLVVVEVVDHATLLDRGQHQLVVGPHPLAVLAGDPLTAQPRGLALEQSADAVDVHELRERQALHDRALVRLALGQPRLLEAADRFPDGHHAGSHLVGEVTDPEARAGRQLAADDRGVKGRVDLIREQSRRYSLDRGHGCKIHRL